MIGVIPKADEIAAIEEFFQLFKTPWELYQPGHAYDAVITGGGDLPDVDARLIVVYGTESKDSDRQAGIAAGSRSRAAKLNYQGTGLPLYGGTLTFEQGDAHVVCVTTDSEIAGLGYESAGVPVVRIGYDLFQEVAFLLSTGQPVENARVPTLEIHIRMLRNWMLEAGITVLEIPPVPAGSEFIVCLTHDIDFVGIGRHKFDHTMWGFVWRSTLGAGREFLRGRLSLARLLQCWQAVVLLPFIYLGWAKDYWVQFEWYLQVEKGLPATYFLIPFKHRQGDRLTVKHPERRASKYDIGDIPEWTAALRRAGNEIGVHGIDAWHSVEKGREELKRTAEAAGGHAAGVRMHWLVRDGNTFPVMEDAGYAYDSTAGYNEDVGYRCGTTQVFRPLDVTRLLEVPLHIQDGALFYRQRLNLSDQAAWEACQQCIDRAREYGGVLTVLWHDRSPGPERFWGEFYSRLVEDLKTRQAWFGTAGQAAGWFQKRREVRFERVEMASGGAKMGLRYAGGRIEPPLSLRVHHPCCAGEPGQAAADRCHEDVSWGGEGPIDLDQLLGEMSEQSTAPGVALAEPA